ncbi:uncharacterized protein CANTADRAFT_44109 [Suhomyces tanzawaensis NRRL Y-17324]|uniref:RNA polymerase II-associated protein RBA50 n=1 Tax=Suhomyces tanzawaensis NRRL Y-17324 TaxID=984487 RepID=A0A1E4SQ84_9ASCO|nr:uncharacterized protein CANTADRAFT_44109 [Suhomyces tanzawaensis NRRL Y-17324]ODV81659.1 hypothetical protein CANTADRAFT_44109 [Suhomyces tanzawaensis NRRL Y-17324]
MDFVGEIVEHETEVPMPPVAPTGPASGFPDPGKLKLKRESRWKSRNTKNSTQLPSKVAAPKDENLSEAEKIHRENMARLGLMSEEEISREQQELLSGLDPKLIQSLLKRTESRITKNNHSLHDSHLHDGHSHAEGYNGWIGGVRTAEGMSDLSHLDEADVNKALGLNPENLSATSSSSSLSSSGKSKKSVKFNTVATIKYDDMHGGTELAGEGWEDVDDLNDLIPGAEGAEEDEIAPEGYQLVSEEDEANDNKLGVHFTKPKDKHQDLDLNDPDFYDKLHEKYYPDLPKETEKLSWMTKPLPKQVSTTYESISDMRFDFKGDLVELNDETKSEQPETPTYMGLHHHSDNPHLAGYTLAELAHLSRSVLPGQRCLSIQMLGRILHKLGLHKYSILPVDDSNPEDTAFNENMKELVTNFENLMWNLIEQLRIIDSITEAADEKKTRNLSVRNYAIEALWLWKQGGGKRGELESEEEAISKALQN